MKKLEKPKRINSTRELQMSSSWLTSELKAKAAQQIMDLERDASSAWCRTDFEILSYASTRELAQVGDQAQAAFVIVTVETISKLRDRLGDEASQLHRYYNLHHEQGYPYTIS